MSRYLASKRIGIMGGGQLARMLVEVAYMMGVTPVVYAERVTDCAAQICAERVIAKPDDLAALQRFFSTVDLVIFENEFAPFHLYEEAARGLKVSFFPEIKVMLELSDKARQKEILSQLGIATAPYLICPGVAQIGSWVDQSFDKFGEDQVFKWGKRGYDGKGILIAPTRADRAKVIAFAEEGLRNGARVYSEQKIDFLRELAIIGCASTAGQIMAYPLVISEQRDGICSLVRGPACLLGVSVERETRARSYIEKLVRHLGLLGVFAIELFETTSGELLVNEIAPRVHNSGHYSQRGCYTSQFENHIRAALQLTLGSVDGAPFFAMYNLLGPEDLILEGFKGPLPVPQSHIFLHWYGKDKIAPRRKIGHLNAVARDERELEDAVSDMFECETAWLEILKEIYEKAKTETLH